MMSRKPDPVSERMSAKPSSPFCADKISTPQSSSNSSRVCSSSMRMWTSSSTMRILPDMHSFQSAPARSAVGLAHTVHGAEVKGRLETGPGDGTTGKSAWCLVGTARSATVPTGLAKIETGMDDESVRADIDRQRRGLFQQQRTDHESPAPVRAVVSAAVTTSGAMSSRRGHFHA